MRCVLRKVRDEDLPLLFEQRMDPIAGAWRRYYARSGGLRRIRAPLVQAESRREFDNESHRRRRRSHGNDWVLG